MTFKLTENEITFGEGNEYALPDLRSWKVWKADTGKCMAKVQPKHGNAEVFEVEFEATFTGKDGTVIPNPEYFILSWITGMAKPECLVKSGDKHMAADWSVEDKPKRRRRPSMFGLHEVSYEGEKEDDL